MSRRRVAVLAALAVTVSVLVAGCTQDAGPKPSPLPSTTKTASPSSTAPTPPVMPAEAKGTSAKSAKAFVRYWVETLNYSGPAGESGRLRSLSSNACVDCDAIGDFIDTVHRHGGEITGDGWDVTNVRVLDRDSTDQVVLDALVQVAEQTVIEAKGKKPKTFPGGQRLKTFWLKHHESGWRVSRLDQSE